MKIELCLHSLKIMIICVSMGEQPDINSNAPRPSNLDQGETTNQGTRWGQIDQ